MTWVVGAPRSGTTLVAEFLGRHADRLYNEPFGTHPRGRPHRWVLPTAGTVVFKYCENWSQADTLTERWPASRFVHPVRDPASVVYSLVFPKADSRPYRDLFHPRGPRWRFGHAVELWRREVAGARSLAGRHPYLEVRYERLPAEVAALRAFTGLPLDPAGLAFAPRNEAGVDPDRAAELETYWGAPAFAAHRALRREIEDDR